jgi:flagellar hook-associated protein 1
MANILTSLTSAANSMGVYEKAMEVVQNDTTNATTPGYVRQTLNMVAQPFTLDGGAAGGVSAGEVLSSRDLYAEQNVQTQQSALAYSSTLNSNLSVLNPIFDVQSTTGIAGSLNSLFSAFSQLTVTPNDSQMRQSVLAAAQSLGNAFQATSQGLVSTSASLDQDAANTVKDVNNIVSNIQSLNVQRRQNAGAPIDPGLDAQMYSNLESLSKYVNFSSIQAADGTMNIFLGGQEALLVGTEQVKLQISPSPAQLSVQDANGNDVSALVTQGSLAAIVQARNTLIPSYQTQLNTLAAGVADTINNQLTLGVDQNGQPGAPLFTYNTLAPAKTFAVSSTITTPQIAAASAANPGGNDNAIALSQLQSATPIGGFTFTQAFGNLSADVGRDISDANNNQTTGQQLLAQAQTLRSNASSVSLDEEATRLIQYQQAYEATSKLIVVINDMTQALLGIIQ